MQDLEKFKNEMNLSGKNVYVGNRYVPKIMGDWSNDKTYEPLSVVTYQGASYTSRQYVPTGVEITNEDFWVLSGNYNAQVEHYRQEVINVNAEVKTGLKNVSDEVENARNGELTLTDRLDKEQQEFTTQLSQTKSLLHKGKKEKKPLVVLLSDDARDNDKVLLMPIMQEKNVSIGFGVVTSAIGTEGVLDFDELRELEQAGGEILSHSHAHINYAHSTDAERISDLETSLNILNENGFYPEGFIYPFNESTVASEMIVSRYFNYAYGRSYGNSMGRNFPILNNQRIDRVALDTAHAEDPNHPGVLTNTLEYYKAKVDEGVENNSIVAFMMHADTMDSTQLSHLRNLIDYARTIGAEIVSPKEAFDIAGNIIEVRTEDYDFKVGADGQYVGQNLAIVDKAANKYTADDTLGSFRPNTVTHSHVTGSLTTGMPENKAGLLSTYRLGTEWPFTKQEFRPFNSVGLWQRTVQTDGSWSDWKNLDSTSFVETESNKYTADDTIGAFKINTVTHSYVTGSATTGLPNDKAGILTTYRLSTEWPFTKQEYRPVNDTGLWQRTVKTDGSWSEWEDLNPQQRYIVETEGNKYTAQTPITEFTLGTVTTSYVTGTATTGTPNDTAGVLTTYRVGDQNGFWRQEFKAVNTTGTWERLVLSSGDWGEWVKITN